MACSTPVREACWCVLAVATRNSAMLTGLLASPDDPAADDDDAPVAAAGALLLSSEPHPATAAATTPAHSTAIPRFLTCASGTPVVGNIFSPPARRKASDAADGGPDPHDCGRAASRSHAVADAGRLPGDPRLRRDARRDRGEGPRPDGRDVDRAGKHHAAVLQQLLERLQRLSRGAVELVDGQVALGARREAVELVAAELEPLR